jgi:hypothetical protein
MALYSDPIEQSPAVQALGVDQFYSSTPDVLKAVAEDIFTNNITPSFMRGLNRTQTNHPYIQIDPDTAMAMNVQSLLNNGRAPTPEEFNPAYQEAPLLSPEEANAKYGIRSGNNTLLGWTQPVREIEAQELNRLKHEELGRQDIINRGQGGFFQGLAKFVVGAGASMIDPANLLSTFVPVFGEARAAAMLARAGEAVLPRMAVRAGIGAVEGAAGAALLEPFNYTVSHAEQRDYSMTDSLSNIAFGGILGGGLHAGFGVVADHLFGIGHLIDQSSASVKQAMLGDALTATMEGRPVRADLALRESLLGGTSLRSPYEQARVRFDSAMGPFAPAEPVGIDLGGGPEAGVSLPHPVPDRTGAAIPILNDRGQPQVYQSLKTAQNAVDRWERNKGFSPEIVETSNGYVLRAESNIETIRNTDGSVMSFQNERKALRYRDQILRDPNLDVIPVSDGGPVRYALVAGAQDRDLKAARAHPQAVDLRTSRDLPQVLAQDAQEVARQRRQFLDEVSGWNQGKLNPVVRATPQDLRILAEGNAVFERAQGERGSMAREGRIVERTQIERELADLESQINAVRDVGELPADAEAELSAGEEAVNLADQRASMFDRIAGCLRGAA